MDHVLSQKRLPPGFRFHPTEEELFMYYLKRKVLGQSLRSPAMMTELDVYKFAPWDLPDLSRLKTRDLNWYFFCPRAKKYSSGGRTNRATEFGYWKSTGNDREVQYRNRLVGKIKTLIFHRGKAPHGERTDWVMHEYRMEDNLLAEKGVAQDSYVICKIFHKSGLGPKNGEQYGAPFVEEEWETDDDDDKDVEADQGLVDNGGIADNPNASIITSDLGTQNFAAPNPFTAEQLTGDPRTSNVSAALTPSAAVDQGVPSGAGLLPPPSTETEEDELDRLLAMFTADEPLQAGGAPFALETDFFSGLPDLDGGPSGLPDLDWSHYLADDSGGFLELNDLLD